MEIMQVGDAFIQPSIILIFLPKISGAACWRFDELPVGGSNRILGIPSITQCTRSHGASLRYHWSMQSGHFNSLKYLIRWWTDCWQSGC
jgi:hypothetical protein